MKTLTELYSDVAKFRSYVPYAEPNLTFQEISANACSAYKQICIVLTKEIYDSIISGTDEDLKSFLLTATANLIMAKQLVFSSLKQRRAGVDVYKYEQEAMNRTYTENYYNAMDSLLESLPNNSKWPDTPYGKQLTDLRIKDAAAFDSLYRIDGSYLFFYRAIPIQQEVLDDYLTNYYSRTTDETITRQLDRILAKMVVSISVQRFDLTELPASIRSVLVDSDVTRTGAMENQRSLELSSTLMNEAKERLKDVDMLLNSPDSTTIDTESSFNTIDDKIILI